MVLSKNNYARLIKTGIPLSEINRNIGEKPKPRPPVFVPAESAAQVSLLTEIRDELKAIKDLLAKK